MQEELITLGILFFFALVGGIIAARFKQPLLMGLLIVGAIIGPNALGIIHSESIMSTMIDLGAILILFVIGLEFDLSKLKKIGPKAVMISVLNSSILIFVGFVISTALGFGIHSALFMGIILAFGSTAVIVKVLENKGYMDRQEVPLLIAILITEDILAVSLLTFFSGIQNSSTGIFESVESLLISMCLLMLFYVAFVKFIKPMLEMLLSVHRSEEIITFMALAMCAGFSYIASYIGLSPAVGAFMAGSIVASLPNAREFEKSIEPYNMIISAFFFLAIGTMVNFHAIMQNIMIILILVVTVIVIKLTAFSSIVYFFANVKGERMLFASMAMCSVGEFSLLIARESVNFGVGIDLVSISAAVITISAIIMSLTIGYSDRLYEPTIDKLPWKMKKGMERISDYVKTISDELDLESKHSKGLKTSITHSMVSLLIILLSIFGWRKASIFISPGTISTTLYITTLFIVAGLMLYFIYSSRKTFHILSEIISNATNTRNTSHSRTMVKRIFAGFAALLIGILFPFVMFMLNLGPIFLIVSGVMISIAILELYKAAKSTDISIKEPIFTSHHFETERHKNGWRI